MVIKRLLQILSLSALVLASAAQADAPRIGLVLSGGGARGAAHIGVLQVLREMRIPIHAIAGTSMGALVGGAYASGLSAEEMERRVIGVDWDDLFQDDPPRPVTSVRRKQQDERPTWNFSIGYRDGEVRLPKGAIAGQKVQLFFADLVSNSERFERFDRLPIPFRAVATDLESGQMMVFDRGSLSEALRASMSVPGLFAPIEIDNRLYVDGGLVRNLPVDVVRRMGVDTIIAVNLGTPPLKREQLETVVGVAGQMIAILTEQNVQRSLKELDPQRDLLIVPDLGDISASDFKRADEAIAIGIAAARGATQELSRFSVGEAQYAAWRKARFGGPKAAIGKVDEVRITGLELANPEQFESLKENIEGRPLDRPELEREIQALYGEGDYERISYDYIPYNGSNLLIVNALEKSWGPGYFNFGLGLSSDFQGDNRFGIRGVYNRTWLNDRGAQWTSELTLGNEPRLFTELYQPTRWDREGFIAPYLDLYKTPLSVFSGNDDRLARYDVRRFRAGVDLGTTFGTAAEARLGTYYGYTSPDLDTGDPLLETDNFTDTGIRFLYLYDMLDDGFLPRSGKRVSLRVNRPLEALGADVEYTRLQAEWRGAFSTGPHSLLGTVRAGTSFDDSMPYWDRFALGGFLNLSGYNMDQFRGNQLAYGNLVYFRKVAAFPAPLGRGLYLGGSLEVGRLWDTEIRDPPTGAPILLAPEKTRYGGSLFLAADSFVGPFYLAWGISGEGDHSFYVLLGQPSGW
jgi:NTE family protein